MATELKEHIAELARTKEQMKLQSFGKNEDPMKDDDFMRKLGALKWKGETPAWLNIDLMNRGV